MTNNPFPARHTSRPPSDDPVMPPPRVRWLALATMTLGLAACPRSPNATVSRGHDAGATRATEPPTDAGAEAGAVRTVDLPDYFARKKKRPRDGDLCDPAEENLALAETAILEADRRAEPPAPMARWDHASAPRYLGAIAARFALTRAEQARLAQNGFVVPARLEERGYALAFHELYQSQLPIYVSADAILHAVYKANDALLEGVETETLAPRTKAILEKMHATLARAAASYPPETAKDADLFLTVARRLLAEEDQTPPDAVLGVDAESASLVERATAAKTGLTTVPLFGRPRVIDFSQYAPRGHYAARNDLARYFRTTMWLSRLEMNLVSRSSRSSQPGIVPNPEETPREAVLALALADLAEKAGVLDDLDVLETAWSNFAGKREDVPFRVLLQLRASAGIASLTDPDAPDRLKKAIGTGFVRTARIHYMPEGSKELPVIATMLGPRIVPDTVVETRLVHANVVGRDTPGVADVAYFLGSDRASRYLARDLRRFPGLSAELARGRAEIAQLQPTDMYSAWLASIRELSRVPEGVRPSFAATEAFQDLRMNGIVTAYGQLRHNYVLVAGQGYSEGGCEIPDGYVDPAAAVYEALAQYARRGKTAMHALGHADGEAYFQRLERRMNVLTVIANDELAGRPLSEAERRWMSMVVEIVPPSSDGPGSFDGWYFDLFNGPDEAFAEHAFLADWFTGSNDGVAVYAGATNPRLGIFVVDTGGQPRAVVGPVARGFQHTAPLTKRLSDKDVTTLASRYEPWAASYTVPKPAEPPIAIFSFYEDDEDAAGPGRSFAVRAARPLGSVTVELLGHHRDVLGKAVVQVGTSFTRVRVPLPKSDQDSPERFRLRVGEATVEASTNYDNVNEGFGGVPALEWEKLGELQSRFRARAKP